MQVTLFQDFDSRETFLWTDDEINRVELDMEKKDRRFKINGVDFLWKYKNKNDFLNFNFDYEKGVNVIVIGIFYDNELLDAFYDNLKKYDNSEYTIFICFSKECENWGFHLKDSKSIVEVFEKFTYIKLIWDSPYREFKTLLFSPKIALHSYFNNTKSNIECFYWGRNAFDSIKKTYRVGLHINKLSEFVRIYLAKLYYKKNRDGIFFTTSRDCPINQKHTNDLRNDFFYLANYNSPNFDFKIREIYDNGVREGWYVMQFFEQTIKSSVEIVYESWTHTVIDKYNIKLTEKTLKHVYLGKPFIHADPYAHQVLKKLNILPYKPLYIPELWEYYENWDINKNPDYSYLDLIEKNINWLLDLPEHIFGNILQECSYITSENRNIVDKTIYKTTLIDLIKSNL